MQGLVAAQFHRGWTVTLLGLSRAELNGLAAQVSEGSTTERVAVRMLGNDGLYGEGFLVRPPNLSVIDTRVDGTVTLGALLVSARLRIGHAQVHAPSTQSERAAMCFLASQSAEFNGKLPQAIVAMAHHQQSIDENAWWQLCVKIHEDACLGFFCISAHALSGGAVIPHNSSLTVEMATEAHQHLTHLMAQPHAPTEA